MKNGRRTWGHGRALGLGMGLALAVFAGDVACGEGEADSFGVGWAAAMIKGDDPQKYEEIMKEADEAKRARSVIEALRNKYPEGSEERAELDKLSENLKSYSSQVRQDTIKLVNEKIIKPAEAESQGISASPVASAPPAAPPPQADAGAPQAPAPPGKPPLQIQDVRSGAAIGLAILETSEGAAPAKPGGEPPEIPGYSENQCLNALQAHNQAIMNLGPEVKGLQDKLLGLDPNSPEYQKTLEELNGKKGSLEYSEQQVKWWKEQLDKLDRFNQWGVDHGYTWDGVGKQSRNNLIQQGINPETGLPMGGGGASSGDAGPRGYFDPSALEGEPSLEGLDLGGGGNLLDQHVKGHQDQQSQEAAEAQDLAAGQGEIEDASVAGDEAQEEAQSMVEEAGQEAEDVIADAIDEVVQEEGKDDFVKDVVTDMLTEGGKGFGSGLGGEAADEVIESWDKPGEHHEPPPPPAKPQKPKKPKPHGKPDGHTGATDVGTTEHKPTKPAGHGHTTGDGCPDPTHDAAGGGAEVQPPSDPGIVGEGVGAGSVMKGMEDPVPRRKTVTDSVYED